jgi:signal peptidase I
MTKMHGQKPAGHDANAVDGFRMTGKYVKADQAQLTMPSAAFAILMTAVLDKSAPFRFQAAGFSMTPFIRSGDVITIAPTSAPIRFGDVVAFENLSSGKLVVHRVVRVSSDSYIIKGDNSPESDEVVPVSRILGRVVGIGDRAHRHRLFVPAPLVDADRPHGVSLRASVLQAEFLTPLWPISYCRYKLDGKF